MGIELVEYRPEMEQWYVYIFNEGFSGWDTSFQTKRSAHPGTAVKTFLARLDSLCVGLIDLVFREDEGEPSLMVDPLGVLPEYRRHGIGKKLVDTAATWALDNGYGRIYAVLQSGEPRLHKFYRNSGFRQIAFRLVISKEDQKLEVTPEEYNEKHLDWTIRHFAYYYMRPLAPQFAANQTWDILK
ncbi:MAG TPA: GNAT family N-acetyltransferase [Chroococcales cyanobacterium]|jgi:GNAT superfamily N-acetyltransferase